MRNKSCSRKNFCANLTRELFTEEEMKSSNVRGVLGKNQLDPLKIAEIKKVAFHHYPLVGSETEKQAWTDCIKSIDEKGRRLNRKKYMCTEN